MSNKNFRKDYMLDFLYKHAPKAPLGDCVNLANQFQRADDDEYASACALAVLSSYFCGEHGELLPEKMPETMTPVLKWAFDRLQYRHGWVCCGPSEGMSKFLERMEKTHCKKQ